MKTRIMEFLLEAGYSEQQVHEGFRYADKIGYGDADRLGQLALSRILYSDEQLKAGDLVSWTPIEAA